MIEIKVKEKKMFFFFKRLVDIVGSIAGLLLLTPILLLVSSFYLFGDNKGPIIFKQSRIGKNGEKFDIYKFRSMVIDAEEKLNSDEYLLKKYINNNYKLEPSEDPRITKFGEFIRKTSLDELPQFFNILKGQMSLVGPRPVIEKELEEYGDQVEKFLSVKPGVTGYWQISGRSNIGYPERVDIELYYIDKASFKLDLNIMCLTVIHVIMKKGAY